MLSSIPSDQVAAQLTEDEIMLREAFAIEYIECRSPVTACLKLGFILPYAQDWAEQFMSEGYVLKRIDELEKSTNSQEIRRNKYITWMEKQATDYSSSASHAARVAAINILMKLEGMFIIENADDTIDTNKVMVVPEILDSSEWTEKAQKSQKLLMLDKDTKYE